MDLLIVLTVSFLLLIFSVLKGYFIVYPLVISLLLLILTLARRGFAWKRLIKMAVAGSRQSWSVIIILVLIGAVIATWLAAGTVPAMVYYGVQWIRPRYFILSAFLLTSLISLIIETSFCTAGTIGLALIIIANSSTINSNLVAGAIMSGAYFGDRCSPLSSSANLVATMTRTQLYRNIQNMMLTGGVAFGFSCVIYGIFSALNPVEITNTEILNQIRAQFDLHPVVLAPAAAILILAIFRVEVKLSMIISLGLAVVIAVFLQENSGLELVRIAWSGFHLPSINPLSTVFQGGGITAMLKVALIVLISTAFSGVLIQTHSLQGIQNLFKSLRSERDLFLGTILVSLATSALGCTQTIAILLTQQLTQETYQSLQLKSEQLAVDLENSAVVIAPLIPWNIACLIPATVLMADFRFIPYAVYLYLLPLLVYFQKPTVDMPTAKAIVSNSGDG
ncbi:MAG: Na+/H+ antiporter NhaC family protein [Microcoleaceae cyanobacterium]